MMLKLLLLVAAALILLLAGLILYGARSWRAYSQSLQSDLTLTAAPIQTLRYDEAELAGLPEPVGRYFKKALRNGQRIISSARIRHRGTFNMSETGEDWKKFRSEQFVLTERPGFDWEARIQMIPGVAAKVHDAYIAGEGLLQVSLFGFERLVDLGGTPEMAQGEFMRYLAESVWYPTSLLPSRGVVWEPVDDSSARAFLKDGENEVSLIFHFSEEGLIDSISSTSRMRAVKQGMRPTAWECRLGAYEMRENILIPLEGEVLWRLPEGDLAYWRGRIEEIRYKYAE